jgi:hypothetical protein
MSATKVIGLLVGAVFITIGVSVIAANQRSEDQITRQAAAAASADYHPMCDDKTMQPGDTCLRFGGNRGSQTYGEMMSEYYAENTTDKIRARYRTRQGIGAGVGAVGVLIVIPIIVLALRRKKVRPGADPGPYAMA